MRADCDWIVICPCGLDLKQTAKELPAMTSQQWWCALADRLATLLPDQRFDQLLLALAKWRGG